MTLIETPQIMNPVFHQHSQINFIDIKMIWNRNGDIVNLIKNFFMEICVCATKTPIWL